MKQLSEMSHEELWTLFPIVIQGYNPEWAKRYLAEKALIERTIDSDKIFRVSHIGSTAVPGLDAKPTIDILLEIYRQTKDEEVIDKMKKANYIYTEQKENPAPHMMFLKGYTTEGFKGQAFHVHVRYPGDWDEFYFRDYLVNHPHIAQEYGVLKLKLKETYEFNRDGYTEAKTDFIRNIMKRARLELVQKYQPKDL